MDLDLSSREKFDFTFERFLDSRDTYVAPLTGLGEGGSNETRVQSFCHDGGRSCQPRQECRIAVRVIACAV